VGYLLAILKKGNISKIGSNRFHGTVMEIADPLSVESSVSSSMSNGGHSVLLAAGDTREGTGILANDPLGLCIGSEGHVVADANSGVFTSMIRLASQLQNGAAVAPLITIETEDSTILVKAYDGNAVALKVPTSNSVNMSPRAPSSAESNGAASDVTSGIPSDAQAPGSSYGAG
jgi:Ragulator complex protein LAMTOR5